MFFSRFPKKASDPEQKLLINNDDPDDGTYEVNVSCEVTAGATKSSMFFFVN